MSVWYLDLDDEITDAVARLRAAKDDKVVLVLPPGSRIGTGRINFRLLAREAETRGLTVALVSGDAQVRALSASAGLTAHGTVADAERSLGLQTAEPAPVGARSTTAISSLPPAARVSSAVSVTADAAAGGSAAGAAMAAPVSGSRFGSLLHRRREGYAVTPRTATAVANADGTMTVIPVPVGEGARIVRRGPSTKRRVATWGTRGAILGALGAGAMYVAYLTLPTATVRLTPGSTTLDPVSVAIVASPNTPGVDAVAGTIFAERVGIPMTTSATFPATGTEDVLTRASGKVVFANNNTSIPVSIREGMRVATADGREYVVKRSVDLPKYSGDPPRPTVEVEVEAARPGDRWNTSKDTVRVVPKGYDRVGLTVNNPEPITGGDRDRVRTVDRKDCQAAQADLLARLDQELAQRAAEPGTDGLKRFAASASLGDVQVTPLCRDLVGQVMPEFVMTAQTTGSVLEVDQSVLEATAARHFQGNLDPGTIIEPDSIRAQLAAEPIVTTETVTYPMSVTAEATLPTNAADIKTEIAGESVEAAKEILSKYGTATLTVWPEFVPTVPTDTSRITLDVIQ